ncbi:MAG: protein translocase subunit SecD [Parachlamydiales bacterium]|nr:protein translocase subunit SecD [Parachlamydiales bacterium]
MEKQKKWQFFLILTVIALTLYNIFPTLFYYLKPLGSPITESQALDIASSIDKRIAQLESDSKEWLRSFCHLIHASPQSIEKDGQNFVVRFAKSEEANRFRRALPRAGSLIPFVPAQLGLAPQESENVKEVVVARRISAKLDKDLFSFAAKDSANYREVMIDRAVQIAYTLAGPSESALALSSGDSRFLESLAYQIQTIAELEESQKAIANRMASAFTQGPFPQKSEAVRALVSAFEQARDQLKKRPEFEKKEPLFIKAEKYLKQHEALFASGADPWNMSEIRTQLAESSVLRIGNRNPLFSEISIDWPGEKINLKLHPDVDRAKLEQPLMNEAAKVARFTNESLTSEESGYSISFHELGGTTGLLVLNLEKLLSSQSENLISMLKNQWHPQHPDLQSMSIVDDVSFHSLNADQKALSLIIRTPNEENRRLQIFTNGLERIIKTYEEFPNSEPAKEFQSDFRSLVQLLQQNGFSPFRGEGQELIFEKQDPFHSLLAATREDFHVKGTQKYAFLELSNLEQRILTANRIDTKIHEDLMKWQDEYNAAQVSIQPNAKFDVPKPIRSVFLSNLALSWKKYFRGDEKKVIHWGLDLSGGKTVQIELRDANNRIVKNDDEIKQGINELYNRVNKMGVSEVAIRQLGNNIVLDFPGSQSLSASELIKASSMYFHVVNEKFSSPSSPIAAASQRFLQEVYNEAVVKNRKDLASINAIAWKHLHSDAPSEAARTLMEAGLVLQSPEDPSMSSNLDDSVCKLAVIRGEQGQWFGQSHPLLFVFKNYTLEGSELQSVHASYDPQKGNYLSFEVAKSGREILKTWTSRYSKDRIMGTPLEDFSKGHGWRMAVILNDTVISAPTLEAVISDSAQISGSFSQREVNALAADLKAGSLSFTPHILSEKNVSPELGIKDRTQGIIATVVALLLVVGSMVAYYRFAGVVASVAVLFNLLILWATLQNIGATLSLAGIAGIILTVGMAVDANVLVFERFKEEFAHSGKIGTAIAAAYKKAYSAIVDSNVTTIIAALILLNFDAGPIKGFAITLIIGIVSSMFTALFMTRYYFNGWVKNPKHTELKMASWIRSKSIDFLKQARLSFAVAALIIVVGGYLVYAQRSTIFGMDFTGGFSLQVEMEPKQDFNYLTAVEEAFKDNGAKSADFQVRQLNPSNHLRILFGTSMQQAGKPFYNMPIVSEEDTNPRIDWVVNALSSKGLTLTQNSMDQLEANWTAMSGQMSDSMRNNALIGLLISFVCIFIYITFRFEYKFAAASIICLLHDVFITIGLMGILHLFGVPVQIDLNTVAAIMTIVGYSLNDTIIIFDRIREEMHLSKNRSLPKLVNHALNATLSRTSITSGTTLLVLIALVILGGSSIFSFALVMTIGVFFGTLSSWYIASPLMLYFHGREEKELAKQN